VIQINYERCGSGSPLVLLHGIGHRWQAWRPVLDQLAERHEVFALDLPGFGMSPPLPPGYTHDLAGSIRMLAVVFEQLGLDRPHVAGNSLGGLMSVEAAAQGLVRSATALSPAGFWTASDRVRALSTLRMIRAGALAPAPTRSLLINNARLRAATLAVLYAHPQRIDRITAHGDLAALRAASSFAPTMRAGRGFAWAGTPSNVPLTIAWGDRDRILPARQAQRAARLLPDAHHVPLPGCGHVPMVDDPALVARTILDTCDRADREAATQATATQATATRATATRATATHAAAQAVAAQATAAHAAARGAAPRTAEPLTSEAG
jgi:pimeloyl-ACP methyl ester carboxylesterase